MIAPAEVLAGADRLFDRVYSSRDNPLYRTGTLAALTLALALVTGVYLLLVYEIGRPWESVEAIQRDLLLGRWIRALHRYASDAAVVAVALHVLRLVAQGKTWGPRTLAWVTGVLLAGMMLVSAVTGFVLVWDGFGQKLAVAGARMLRLLPLFPEPPDRAFVGEAPMPAQFFFMNLFLHVAVPLGMVCFLWLHTARLARAAWFPERRVTLATLAGLTLLAVAWPAPLPPRADLLAIPGRIATDWFYGFWLPLAERSPLAALALLALLAALLLAVPWLLRPAPAARPGPAGVDPETCEGCQQCFQDCPYDAIRMVQGLHPELHPLLAQVQPDLCVSCGLCAGSCASLAIGPPARTAREQLATARRLVAGSPDAARRVLLVACASNGRLASRLHRRYADDVAWFDVDCAGTLHPGTVAYLGRHFADTLIVPCPPQNCVHREGTALAHARLEHERAPSVAGQIARLPVRLLDASVGEWDHLVSAIESRRAPGTGDGATSRRRWPAALALSAAVLGLLALGSGAPQGVDAGHARLRLGWRLAGQTRERCRDLTAAEQAARPVHMRRPRECTGEALAYELTAVVDGRVVSRKLVASPGLRGDRPLSVEEEIDVTPGEHAVSVTFAPQEAGSGGATLALERRLRFVPARIVLVTYDGRALTVRER
ncbi:MAG TPA: 4Fe-4S binding protein [Candidatus Binatia bacterium]|nr:4Fe-4S binding protein [Candidatus Binatia bacterium]